MTSLSSIGAPSGPALTPSLRRAAPKAALPLPVADADDDLRSFTLRDQGVKLLHDRAMFSLVVRRARSEPGVVPLRRRPLRRTWLLGVLAVHLDRSLHLGARNATSTAWPMHPPRGARYRPDGRCPKGVGP